MAKIKIFNIPDPYLVVRYRFIAIFLSIIGSVAFGIFLFVNLQLTAEGSIGYESIVRTIVENAAFSFFVAFVLFWCFRAGLYKIFGIKK